MTSALLPKALDVVSGIDLAGRLAIITGGHSGLGLETTRALASAGARVVVTARDTAAATRAVGDIADVAQLDLADLGSVRRFADRVLASGPPVHLLMANAGVMAMPETRVGDGWEAQFAINHLGHFALVNQLWPALVKAGGARVVVTASGLSRMHWDDPQFERGYDKWAAYLQSKTANRLFAASLDRRGAPHGLRAFSATPGYILTPLQRHLSRAEMVEAGWIDSSGAPVNPSFRSPEQGAATQVWAATSPSLVGKGGLHCEDCAVVGPAQSGLPEEEAERLWEYSVGLVGD